MIPAAFHYEVAGSVEEAVTLLQQPTEPLQSQAGRSPVLAMVLAVKLLW